ncbi:SAV_2336 N-terminal domain-related protein [Streptomyces avermitilis]|uniref:SAV_2336 N-terminal domain-related protein n=1 Tax=Streptomyces avermitilis TaxID=33903 RepID=UPI0036B9B01E
MIARLREALRTAGYDPEPEEIADILWLAAQNLQRQTNPMPTPEGHASAEKSSRRAPRPPGRQRSEPIEASLGLLAHRKQTLYSTAEGPGGPGPAVTHVRISTPKALPQLHSLERSLRPLRATVRSRVRHELDLAATIATIAEGFPDVALRPAREMLLDATLVVDDGLSMAIWHDAAYELYQALHRLRAFGRIRLLGMDTNYAAEVQLTSEPFRPGAPRASALASERHLILVLTDAVGEAWSTGAAQRRLHAWARRGPVAVLQVLPERLWQETGLPTTQLMVSAPRAATPNSQLRLRHPRLPRGLFPVPRVAIPVVDAVSGSSASSWARLVVAPAGEVALYIVDLHDPRESLISPAAEPCNDDGGELPRELVGDEVPQRAEQILEDFLGYASQPALRLAAHLACAGSALTIPLMRLIQRSAVPEAGPEHLAEVFLSGLLHPHQLQSAGSQETPSRRPSHESLPWNRRAYAYPPQVASALRELIKRSEEQATLDHVSQYLAHHRASAAAGMALISDPSGVLRTDAQALPLARVERAAAIGRAGSRIHVAVSSDSAIPRLAQLVRNTIAESTLHEVGLDVTRRSSTIRVLFPAGRTEPVLLTTLLSGLQHALEQEDAAPSQQSPIRVAMDFTAPGKPLDSTLRGLLESISRHPANSSQLWVVAASRRLMVELYGPELEGSDAFRELHVGQKRLYVLSDEPPAQGGWETEDEESSPSPHARRVPTVRASEGNFADQLLALSADLTALYIACGSPTLRKISSATAFHGNPVARTTISDALNGRVLPRLDTLLTLVRALLSLSPDGRSVARYDPELVQWRDRWFHLVSLRGQDKNSPRPASSSVRETSIELVPAPDRGVWRLGMSRAPLTYSRYDLDDTASQAKDQRSASGRGILHCASDIEGCFAEALAAFRVHPRMRDLIEDERENTPSLMPLGNLPRDWRTNRVLVRLQVLPDAKFLDLSDDSTLQALNRMLPASLKPWDIQDLPDKNVRRSPQRITHHLSQWAREQLTPTGERLIHGITYRTPYGGHQCWGIFEGVELQTVEEQPVWLETDGLQRVAAEFGLTIH